MRSLQRPLRALRRLVLVAVLERSAVLLLATTAVLPAEAQSRTPDAQATPASALVEAQRAFRSGQYDLVDQLLPPPAGASPDAALLRARAAIARGRYEDAVASLTPLALADRGGPAALELGLLHRTLGRPRRGRTLPAGRHPACLDERGQCHRPRGPRRARPRARATGQRPVPRRCGDGGRRCRAADRVGRPAHRKAPARRRFALVPCGRPVGSRVRTGVRRPRPHHARSESARCAAARRARPDAEPVARLRARARGRTGAERSRHRRGRRGRRARARRQSVEPRGAGTRGGHRLRRGPQGRFRGARRVGAGDQPAVRRHLPHRRHPRIAPLPLRRCRGPDAKGTGDRP